MNNYNLSEGVLRIIMQGGHVDSPVMQILGTKKIETGAAEKDRYRILLSDGKYFISFAMFTTTIKDAPCEFDKFAIVKLNRYVTSVINNIGPTAKRVVIILDCDVLVRGDQVGQKVGNPEQLSDNGETVNQPSVSGHSSSNGHSNNQNSVPVVTGTSKKMRMDTTMDTSLQTQLIHPIASLSPYHNKWVIKARVMNKSSIRTWNNSRGEGKLFSMDLVDESGEIRATAFREQVDKFYDMIEIDKMYYFSKCQIKMANKQFSSLKNDYEMTFNSETVVQLCEDDDDDNVPQTRYDFVPIANVANLEPNSMVDIIGVCKSTSDVQMFQSKATGRDLKKRDVVLVDETSAINLTLWGADSENFDGSLNPIIVVKGAKVGEFRGGKNISVGVASIMKINPDIPEAHKMRGWFDNVGCDASITNISAGSGFSMQTPWMTIDEAKENGLGNSPNGDYYQVIATVLLLRSENMFYKACPTDSCNKKVVDLENGMYRCEKCSREFPNYKFRLLGSANIADCTGNQWISLFSSEVETILGMTAEEVGTQILENSDAASEIASRAHLKQFVFKCRAKYESYNDEQRLKTVAVKVEKINYQEVNKHILSKISALMDES